MEVTIRKYDQAYGLIFKTSYPALELTLRFTADEVEIMKRLRIYDGSFFSYEMDKGVDSNFIIHFAKPVEFGTNGKTKVWAFPAAPDRDAANRKLHVKLQSLAAYIRENEEGGVQEESFEL